MAKAKGWTCQRTTQGKACKFHNLPRTRKCGRCGKTRPARRRPAHMMALDLSYEDYVKLQGGEFCGICGRSPSPTRRLDRDHDHKTGLPRGLLCHQCNRQLRGFMTVEWLQAAIKYLNR